MTAVLLIAEQQCWTGRFLLWCGHIASNCYLPIERVQLGIFVRHSRSADSNVRREACRRLRFFFVNDLLTYIRIPFRFFGAAFTVFRKLRLSSGVATPGPIRA